MFFENRKDAGKKLSPLLERYRGEEVIVYALPRGGVPVAAEIAHYLDAPLDLLLAHKIGHPHHSEYAIGAVSESGHLMGNQAELGSADNEWLQKQIQKELMEMKRKRQLYLKGKKPSSLKGKIAILVDDGIATGLTMQVGILELRDQHPKKIIAVVPVAPRATAALIQTMADDFIALEIPDEGEFLGAVGAYYREFEQVEDVQVMSALNSLYANK